MVQLMDVQGKKQDVFSLRVRLTDYVKDHSVSQTALEFATTRKTVRKWRERRAQEGLDGLLNRSRRPHHSPNQLSPEAEAKIVSAKQRRSFAGALRLKAEEALPYGKNAIHRVLREKGLVKPRKRKYRVKRDLRAIKAQLKPFAKLQVDTKDLSDIPTYYPMLRQGFPRYLYAAREVRSGAWFTALAMENTLQNATIFIVALLTHLKRCGIKLEELVTQTDNGGEYVGHSRAKKRSLFTQIVEDYFHARHDQIPPRRCTYNSDIETANGLVENEFFDTQSFTTLPILLGQMFAYLIYFNFARKNRYKGNVSPKDLLLQCNTHHADRLLTFQPFLCDKLVDPFLTFLHKSPPTPGYHVRGSAT